MERVRFCRGCGEPFGWEAETCPACDRAVAEKRSGAARRRPKAPGFRLTRHRLKLALLFVAVLAALWALSSIPMWIS